VSPESAIPRQHVAHVERIDGPSADPRAAPALLIEVPHGADRRAHYDALRARMIGELPADLHVFFHVNTDVAAWDYGRRVAEKVIAARPDRSALLVRCLVPRTLIDTNRLEESTDGLASGGMTAGVAPYVRHRDDIALLVALHREYVALVERAYAEVCDAGGLALCPHTYGPRSMGIDAIDERIVDALRRAHEPDEWARWPVRPEIDLITRAPGGVVLAPEDLVRDVIAGYRAIGIAPAECATYELHPSTQTARWSARWPSHVLCLEVRRDLLVERYTPFEEMHAAPDAVERIATPLAVAIDRWLAARR
jgi:hypothetical protein